MALRLAESDPYGETIELGVDQPVGAGLAVRVLRRDHHVRLRHVDRLPVDRDPTLGHCFEQRRLGFRRRPVELVDQHHGRQHRTRPEDPLPRVGLEHVDPGDVTRQEIGGALDPLHLQAEDAGQRSGECRLADAGSILDQDMAAGAHRSEHDVDRCVLAENHSMQFVSDAAEQSDRVIEMFHTPSSATLPGGLRITDRPVIRLTPFESGQSKRVAKSTGVATSSWSMRQSLGARSGRHPTKETPWRKRLPSS